METVPKGVPVECLIEGKTNVYLAGAGTLTFPPNRKYMRDGRPRRIEWLINPAHVETLTGPMYNKPRAMTFAVAKDLLQEGQQEALRREVEAVIGKDYVTVERFNTAIAALQKEITDLRKALK